MLSTILFVLLSGNKRTKNAFAFIRAQTGTRKGEGASLENNKRSLPYRSLKKAL
ncbi:hypothetical protein D3C71_151310 [compost metagenome]